MTPLEQTLKRLKELDERATKGPWSESADTVNGMSYLIRFSGFKINNMAIEDVQLIAETRNVLSKLIQALDIFSILIEEISEHSNDLTAKNECKKCLAYFNALFAEENK